MPSDTSGIHINTKRRWLADAVELVSSMRFAISLLTLIAIASTIGTVLKQNEPMPNYVNQFGPFWFDIFSKLGLYSVYSTWWFLLIMAFLVTSTSLCVARNGPKMLSDMRNWRENVREQSLRNFRHKAEWTAAASPADLAARLETRIKDNGYRVKLVAKDDAILVTAKKGAANKLGYIFAHSAIIIICLGALLDSDMPIRFQQWFYGKTPFAGSGIIAQIPAQHRLSVNNPTFRGNTLIPEGASSSTAIIPQQSGVLIQDLPFTIKLNRFVIDYYSTGMPKLFASDVTVRDNETGKTFSSTIKVNEPLIYNGVAVYQSSFEDGGSKLKLTAWPMAGVADRTFEVAGEVNGSTPLRNAKENGKDNDYTVEWSGFRALNIENLKNNNNGSQDARAVNQNFNRQLADKLDAHLGSGAKTANSKDLKNVGPSVQYKLRDKTGQAHEFMNYMRPIQVDGAYVYLAGMRDQPDQPFRYLRIPADDEDSVAEWMRLRAALADPALRERAAQRYASHAMSDNRNAPADMREQLQKSAAKGLSLFAGSGEGDGRQSGFIAVSRFLERMPAQDQEKAADIFMKILNGSLWDLWQVARENAGLKPMPVDERHARFLQLATNALADTGFYQAPVYLQLHDFTEVKASVLQVTRSPGKKVVYFGCLLLVLGVFSMLYIRERRLWIWIRPRSADAVDGDSGSGSDGGSHALLAMSTQRKTLDFEREFETLKAQLTQQA
ncbi:cytochrome c biogenesis protein ResB [Herbaspirillum sp. RTI4]|uniref:cytochrome c biogenesis protein ResB n=1 Tax=Herbaspirillum sp. RTI4 TaxID=3048640 RepID=UPI002AB5501E|nr:cytochrome c biogenesis protein ResB [Herbaspirillum sp. RTI4]MDY7577364.1 cytochrome c biogenesis protein ResB [Herbaspirillum sp. RTI4]MEA9982408.1 cytochrome c biogenesis protein ResB [Herbaspirillum sp. RTI4]